MTDADLWAAALDGNVPLACTALDRLCLSYGAVAGDLALAHGRSEEHTSELQSLMRISYAVFCLKKKKKTYHNKIKTSRSFSRTIYNLPHYKPRLSHYTPRRQYN